MKKLYTDYVSEIDRFFHEFDEKRVVLPAARVTELTKHQKIAQQRDQKIPPNKSVIWKDF